MTIHDKSAECPVCHGTGQIGTTDWLIRGMTQEQLAKKKADAVAEAEREMRAEAAREIFADLAQYGICEQLYMGGCCLTEQEFEELKKKYGVEQ